ncbi:MAG TPA: response regulator [Patescibacteria group bacterium]|nr:response regulator [Patescibacteria group bacterium]
MLQPPTCNASAQKTILLVEDDDDLRDMMRNILETAGFHVIEATTADSVIAVLSAPHDVALVFTDVALPGQADGFTLARMVREAMPDVPVLVTSGKVPRNQVPDGVTFIPKPYILAKVLQNIQEALHTAC